MLTLNSKKIIDTIEKSIQGGETLSPFLFLGENLELLHSELKNLSYQLLDNYNIPKTSIITLEDNGENLKIESIRELLRSSSVRANYDFQVFVIENISRLTLASSNSMLKFLEEPGKGNIIFLTNMSESGVLETILSRVVPVQTNIAVTKHKNTFFSELLSHISTSTGQQNLLSYVYGYKGEKAEYIDFLQTLLHSGIVSPNDMQNLNEDIQAVSNNNVLPKYVLDKWIMKII